MANPTTLYKLPDGRTAINVTENKTLDAGDSGVVQNVIADSVTITLPSTAVGISYIVRNGGVPKTSAPAGTGDDGSMAVTVSPAAADKIQGMDVTAADNKDFINTKATARVGDEIKLFGDGADGWFVQGLIGTWAKE